MGNGLESSNLMSWKDQVLEEASYNGVPFSIETSIFSNKKNTDTQSGSRSSHSSNTSMKKDEFTVSALVFGPNYLVTKTELIKNLSNKEPGKLCHPYYGKDIDVIPGDYSVKELSTKGGCAFIEMAFLPCKKLDLKFTKKIKKEEEKSLLDSISKVIEQSQKILKSIEVWKSDIKSSIDTVDSITNILNDFADAVYSSMEFAGELKAQLNAKALQALKLRARLNDIRLSGPETWATVKSLVLIASSIEAKNFSKELFSSFKKNNSNIQYHPKETKTEDEKEREMANETMSHILSISVIDDYTKSFIDVIEKAPDKLSNKEAEESKNAIIASIDKIIEDSEKLEDLSPITTDTYLYLIDLKTEVQKKTANFIGKNKNRIIKVDHPENLITVLHRHGVDLDGIDKIIIKNNIMNPFWVQGEIEC